MKKVIILWILAFVITIATDVHQRITELINQINGSLKLANEEISHKFAKSNGLEKDHETKTQTNNTYQKFPTNNPALKRFKGDIPQFFLAPQTILGSVLIYNKLDNVRNIIGQATNVKRGLNEVG